MEEVRFEGLSKKIKTIVVDGKTLKIKPKRRHAEMFATLSREEFNEKDAAKITDILIDIIKGANQEANPEDIEAYVVEHFGELILELAPLFRFATRKETRDAIERFKRGREKKITERKA